MTAPPPGPHQHGARAAGPVDWDAEEERAETRPAGTTADRGRWWLGGLALLLLTAATVWFGLWVTGDRVSYVDTGHDIVSAELVEIRFDLRRDPARTAVCQLEAQDIRHNVVGRTRVEVGPAESSPSRHVAAVRTASMAVTGYVDSCWYAGEAAPGQR